MKKFFFTLLVGVMACWLSADARWQPVGQEAGMESYYPYATSYKDLTPGKYVVLRTGSAQDGASHDYTWLMGENMSFMDDDLSGFRSDKAVYLLEDAGINELSGGQMVYFKNVATGKYIGASNVATDPWAAGDPTWVEGTENAYKILLLPANGVAEGNLAEVAEAYKTNSVEGSGYTEGDGGAPLVNGWEFDSESAGHCVGTILAVDPTTDKDRICILNNFGTTGTSKQIKAQTWDAWKPWLVYVVDYTNDPVYELGWSIADMEEMTAQGYQLGTGYVSYDAELVAAYNTLLAQAREMTDGDPTAEEATKMLADLQAAKAAVEATGAGGFTSGKYFLVSANAALGEAQVALTVNADQTGLTYTKYNPNDAFQIFEITRQEGSGNSGAQATDWYNVTSFQNVATGKYIGNTANLQSGASPFCFYAYGGKNGTFDPAGYNQWGFIESAGWSGGIGLVNSDQDIEMIGVEGDMIERTVACPAADSWSHIVSSPTAFIMMPVPADLDLDKMMLAANFKNAQIEAQKIYDEANTEDATEDMKASLAHLKAAMDKAATVTTPTQDDLEDLLLAIKVFQNNAPDPTALMAALDAAQALLDNSVEGADGEYGKYPAQAFADLEGVLSGIDTEPDYLASLSRTEMDKLQATVEEAIAKFQNAMIKPEYNVWFALESAESPDQSKWGDNSTYETKGSWAVATAEGAIGWQGNSKENCEGNPYAYWRFVDMGNNQFAIQNFATGQYINADTGGAGAGYTMTSEPSPFKFRFQSYDNHGYDPSTVTVGIQSTFAYETQWTKSPYGMFHADSNGSIVAWDHADNRIGSAWNFRKVGDEVEAPLSYTANFLNNSYNVITYPAAIEGASSTDTDVTLLYVSGAKLDANGNMTELYLKEYADLYDVEPGTPLILMVGNPVDQELGEEVAVSIDINSTDKDDDGNLLFAAAPKTANGVVGTFAALTLNTTAGYFEGKELKFTLGGDDIAIPANRGYFDLKSVTGNNDDESADYTITFDDPLQVGIQHVVAGNNALVDVYTIDGICIAKGVKASEATKNLKKGLYIINKKVVSVK